MVVVERKGTHTYQGVMYSINGDSFTCYQFYLNYFAGRINPEEWILC